MNIEIRTNKPVAFDSPDHINPFGVRLNNTSNKNFNRKLYHYFDSRNPLYITDWGCAGGAFIKDCIDDGHVAVGLDGSDYRQKRKLPEWNTIPDNLFTCDISNFFDIRINGNAAKFDVITMWDVMEHILEEDLPVLFENIRNHLKTDGIVCMSINVASEAHKAQMNPDDFGPGKHHQNVQPIEWWDREFVSEGFIIYNEARDFFAPDWIRGPGHGCDKEATEERYFMPNLPASMQWATLTRVLKLI